MFHANPYSDGVLGTKLGRQGDDGIENILSPASMRSYPFLEGLQEDF